MSDPPILSTPTAAPTGVEAGRLTPSDLLLLFIVRLFILWAQGLADSLRQRTETTDLADIMRAFGTTDIALILERVTCGLRRLHALEDMILRSAGLRTDLLLEPACAAASLRSLSAPQPLGLKPADVPLRSRLTREQIVAPPVRATGPPGTPDSVRTHQRGPSILSHRGAWQAPSCRFPLPGGLRPQSGPKPTAGAPRDLLRRTVVDHRSAQR
jgi:hypothetical protein